MTQRPPHRDPDWLSLTEACSVLGVSPTTVRRWADAGTLRTFQTPGGHRRFSRASLEAMLPTRPTARPPLTDIGGTPGRLARSYRGGGEAAPGRMPWVTELDPARRERLRHYGRSIVTALLTALDVDDPDRRIELLAQAEEACAGYGRLAAGEHLGAAATAEVFLRFRTPFLAELGAIARRRELDAVASTALMGDANDALDRLLLATLRGWEERTPDVARPVPTRLARRTTSL
jgi:excisionase family DNA binding protein